MVAGIVEAATNLVFCKDVLGVLVDVADVVAAATAVALASGSGVCYVNISVSSCFFCCT